MTGQGLAKTNWTSAPSHLDRNYWRYEFAGRVFVALLKESLDPSAAEAAVFYADALLAELERTAEEVEG
jgi:hypothetical protein